MSDWRLVKTPHLSPHACVTCARAAGVINGDVIDTQRELLMPPDGWRVYLCKRCTLQAATMFELVEPEKGEERYDMRDRIEGLLKENEDRERINLELAEEAEQAQSEKASALEEVERLKMRVAQLTEAMSVQATNASAVLVAGGDPED